MEWKKHRLGDLALSIQTGPFGSQLHQSDYSDYGIPVIMPKDMISGKIVTNNIARVSDIHVQRLKRHKVESGDIIYSRRGDVGRCSLITEREEGWLCGTGCLKVALDKTKCVPSFIAFILQRKDSVGWVENHAVGATMPNLNTGILSNLPVTIPTIEVQRRIASILSAYDNLIENNNKRIRLLEQMAENLYKEWFVRFRFPGHEKVEMENGLPKGWGKVTLDTILEKLTTGLNPRKNFVLGQGENYYVTIKNMGDNTVYLDDNCDKVDDEAIQKINKRSDLKIGDILFSGIGTIGRVFLITIPTDNWNVSESVFTMRANEIVTKEFLYMMLLSDDLQNYCQQHAQGVAQPGIRMSELKAYRFFLPPKNIITKFSNTVSSILSSIDNLRKRNSLLTRQRDLLLPRLMSGRLEVKE